MPQGLRHGDLGMKKNKNGAGIDKSISLIAASILVFGILAAFFFSVER